jgi:hypothetical protein
MRGACVIHVWFMAGSRVVHAWFMCGSCVVHAWFMRGSSVVHVWFMCGSCVVHVWFMRGSCMAHVWFMCGSCVVPVGSYVVCRWFFAVSLYVDVGVAADSLLLAVGSELKTFRYCFANCNLASILNEMSNTADYLMHQTSITLPAQHL